ncbi:MFS transporter [Raoultella terrigena]|uniref:MFS transporter n=1 Tax=Raoultella terrigena TaxID=577 RepID=UPI0030DE6E4E
MRDLILQLSKSSIYSTKPIKIGIAIGGAIIGWLLTMGGYVGNAPVQTESATLVVRLIFTVIPAMLILSLILILKKYRNSEEPDNTLTIISAENEPAKH